MPIFAVPTSATTKAKAKTMSSLEYKEDARDLHAFKELRFFLSHSVPLEIRCSVSRLELPLVADYLLGAGSDTIADDCRSTSWGAADHDSSRKKQQKRGSASTEAGIDGDAVGGGGDCGTMMEGIVRRIVSEPELVATCQLFSDGQPMHKVAMRYGEE